MKVLSVILTSLLLAAPPAFCAGSFSQLAGSAGEDGVTVPGTEASPEAVAEEGSPTASFDFLVRPEAEHEPGAELFSLDSMAEKSAGSRKIPYLELARAEARAQGVDLALVLAVIQKESSFNPKARSSVGAVGLMQLMPDTARWLGLRDTSKLTDPATNIKYGVKYLKKLWDEFGRADSASLSAEDVKQKASRMAIAAYNAGQGNVRKYGDVPPFKETRNYVVKVTQYFSDFKSLLMELPEA